MAVKYLKDVSKMLAIVSAVREGDLRQFAVEREILKFLLLITVQSTEIW